MIQKPPGAERESSAHAAVGRAIEIGGEVRDVSRKGSQLLGKGCAIYFGLAMAFGLIISNTPVWFKAMMLALGYGGYRLIKAAAARS